MSEVVTILKTFFRVILLTNQKDVVRCMV